MIKSSLTKTLSIFNFCWETFEWNIVECFYRQWQTYSSFSFTAHCNSTCTENAARVQHVQWTTLPLMTGLWLRARKLWKSQYFLKDYVDQGPIFHGQIMNHPLLNKIKSLSINIIWKGKTKNPDNNTRNRLVLDYFFSKLQSLGGGGHFYETVFCDPLRLFWATWHLRRKDKRALS